MRENDAKNNNRSLFDHVGKRSKCGEYQGSQARRDSQITGVAKVVVPLGPK
jgi:hypothetical protein